MDTCDYALQISCKIAHIASSVKTAPDFLSRLQLKVTERMRLKVREDIQTTPIEVTTSSLDVADVEHLFFTQADIENELKEPAPERNKAISARCKTLGRKQATILLTTSVEKSTKVGGNTRSYSRNRIKANNWKQIQQYDNTSYHTGIGTEPSRMFRLRFPYNFLDLTMNVRPEKPSIPKF